MIFVFRECWSEIPLFMISVVIFSSSDVQPVQCSPSNCISYISLASLHIKIEYIFLLCVSVQMKQSICMSLRSISCCLFFSSLFEFRVFAAYSVNAAPPSRVSFGLCNALRCLSLLSSRWGLNVANVRLRRKLWVAEGDRNGWTQLLWLGERESDGRLLKLEEPH